MKKLTIILAFIVMSFGGLVFVAHAVDTSYVPLAPLPGTFTGRAGSETTNLSTYVAGSIKLLIALGGALAVLYAIIGGVQYVAASTNPSLKDGAKERITGALIGLTIILTSYLLLNSINPDLVNFKLELPAITERTIVSPSTKVPSVGVWSDDSAIRNQLQTLGININKANCTAIGQQSCTSVYGLGSPAISGLAALKNTCNGCVVTVTGGTEYWLHSTNTKHRPQNSVVDLSKNAQLEVAIMWGSSLGTQASCSSLGPAWRYNGAIYVDEGDHWHVCY